MSRFIKRWGKGESNNLRDRLKNTMSKDPIRPMIERATGQIQIQINKLDSACTRLNSRGLKIFSDVVLSIQRKDTQRASMFANELAEVRKMNKMVAQAKLALEQIMLRLDTVKDLGDIALTLNPAIAVTKSIRSGLAEIVPEAENEIGEISNLLGEIMVSATQTGSDQVGFEVANEDAEKILAEASAVAEQKIKESFPELPDSLIRTIGERTPETA
ncbi:MAG: Snf7 family protein [Nitrososphaerales archaeon]